MGKRLYCIRGAVCAENTERAITQSVGDLCGTLFEANHIQVEDLVSIQFTVTPDIDALNPATALRRATCGLDVSAVPLFCAQEPVVRNMLPRTIRVMLSVYLPEGSAVRPAYLHGAERLRPDLAAGGAG